MEEEYNWCANCRRDIPAVNFVMHSMHCSRNITLCRLCQEPVPRSEVDAHHKEFHSRKQCDLCGEEMDVNLLEKHKLDLCPARKVICSICEIDLPAADIVEHENYCGSRTELCDECGEYIMLKYQKLHLESNHGFIKLDDEPGPKPSWQNNEKATTNGLDTASNHLRYHRKIPNSASGVGLLERNPLFMSSPSKRTNDMPQVNSVPPPHASKSVFKAGLMNPEKLAMNSSSDDNIRSVAALFSDNLHLKRPSSQLQPSYAQEEDLVALPCEFCEALFPANQLILHQTACRPDLARFDGKLGAASLYPPEFSNVSEGLHRRSVDSRQIRKSTLPSFSIASNTREISSALDEVTLLCEFCHKAFSRSKLFEHQSVCTHAWSADVIHNGPISRTDSPRIPQQKKKTGGPIPLEPRQSKETADHSLHGSPNNEVVPVLGGRRKLLKEDHLTNVVRHNNFPKDRKTNSVLPKKDVGQTSLDSEGQYINAARVNSSRHYPSNPVHNEFKDDDGRLALLNKAKAMEAINNHIARNKDAPPSHRNHISHEMAKQFTALHRQPGHNSSGPSSSYGLGSHPSSSNHPQSGRGARTTGAIPKQKAGTSKSPLAF